MDMNRISLKINGRQYPIKSDESIEHLFSVGLYVDKAIGDMLRRDPKLSTEEAAVLAALNMADEVLRLKKSVGAEWSVAEPAQKGRKPETRPLGTR